MGIDQTIEFLGTNYERSKKSMIDLKVLPKHITEDLIKRGHSKETIAKMSPEEVFNEYCNWHGLQGWGESLWEVIHELKDAETMGTLEGSCVQL